MSKKQITRGAVYLYQHFPNSVLAQIYGNTRTPEFLVAATTPTEENCTVPFSTMINILNRQPANICNISAMITPKDFIKDYDRFMKLLRIDRTITERWVKDWEDDVDDDRFGIRCRYDPNLSMADFYNHVIQQAGVVVKFFAGQEPDSTDDEAVEDLVEAIDNATDTEETVIVDASIIKTNVLPAIAEIAKLTPIPLPDTDMDALNQLFMEAFGEKLVCSPCEREDMEDTDNAQG